MVPLLSSSPDDLTLTVGRRPAPMFDETDELFDIDDDNDDDPRHSPAVNDTSIWTSSMNTTLHDNSNDHTNGPATPNTNTFSLLTQAKTSTV